MMGQTVSGTYSVQLTGRDQPLEVYCDMDSTGGGWTVKFIRFTLLFCSLNSGTCAWFSDIYISLCA